MEKEIAEERRELLRGLTGRVVEVGAGNGMNFPHYPAGADVVAVEPEPYLRARAVEAAERAEAPIDVVGGTAESLPLEDSTCDAAVVCLVLCSVADQRAALAELRRVLVPGGEIRFMEHVRSDHPFKARIQRGLDGSGVWPLVAGGCHCSCETVRAIEDAGFDVGEIESFDLGPSWGHTNPHVRGSATHSARA